MAWFVESLKGAQKGEEGFFNRLGYPYSITYEERLAERCPPDAYRAAKGYKGAQDTPEGSQTWTKIDFAE